ncbi:hypothetical protein ACDQ58_08140 [Fusobacterium animalis]|uniref:hypothetical protein n=1 Tax=Fusobacterium TaxID=848 RepID=UPI000339E69E|nr:hypothetical protein [Fusobacterium sp. CAG:649]CDA08984.1 putative uncharacterized protein [Fusobacterium sp. CAG:649]
MGKFIDIPDWLKLDNILEEETDDEIKIELQKIVKYERKELISKYNYINETEEMKKFMKEIYTE